jgi:hypothetical protein
LTQPIFDALRINGTVTSFEVAAQAMRDKGLDPDNDKPTRTDFVRRVALALGDNYRKGKVEKIGRGRALRWKLAMPRQPRYNIEDGRVRTPRLLAN